MVQASDSTMPLCRGAPAKGGEEGVAPLRRVSCLSLTCLLLGKATVTFGEL